MLRVCGGAGYNESILPYGESQRPFARGFREASLVQWMVLREGTGKTDTEEEEEEEGLSPHLSLYPPGKEQTENSYKAAR